MQEASDTQSWLEFCFACSYIDQKTFERLDSEYEKVIAMPNSMEKKSDSFCF